MSLSLNGSVAQLAERALRMREAPGSKPGVSICFVLALNFSVFFNLIIQTLLKVAKPRDCTGTGGSSLDFFLLKTVKCLKTRNSARVSEITH